MRRMFWRDSYPGFGLLFALPVYYLWNGCLVGTVHGVEPLRSIWHAWGVLALCGSLFKAEPTRK
jgi:hypothetical protein